MLELFLFFVLGVLGFFVDFQEAVEFEDRSRHTEPESVGAGFGINIHSGLVEDRGGDL